MSGSAGIPFLDLVTPHLELEPELTTMFRDVLRSAMFIGGPAVDRFEREFALFCDARFCVGVASGTDALRFALMAAGIRPGDAVLTVSNTFIATAEAITQAGGIPEFVDVDEKTYNLDAEKLRRYLKTQCANRTCHRAVRVPADGAADHGRCSRSPVRPNGGHGHHHGNCRGT